MNMLRALPNVISVCRLVAGPLAIVLLLIATSILPAADDPARSAFMLEDPIDARRAAFADAGAWIFVLAALSDWLDGWLARALNATSALGATLDLWADKVLTACGAVLVSWVSWALLVSGWGLSPVLALIWTIVLSGAFWVVVARDALVTVWRQQGDALGLKLPASRLAKAKTALLFVGLVLGVLILNFWTKLAPDAPKGDALQAIAIGELKSLLVGVWLIGLAAAGLAVRTAWTYRQALRVHQNRPTP